MFTKKYIIPLIFILSVFTISFAQEKSGLPVKAYLEWRNVGDPQISPCGKLIIYTYSWYDKIEDKSYQNLWIASTESGEIRPLTQGKYRDSSPRWSPDGKRIAFISNRTGKSQIHVKWLDTGQEAVITDVLRGPGNIQWSPDGKYIAFTMSVPGKPEPGIRIPFKPKGAKWAKPPIVVKKLRWRRDGSGYVRNQTTHIFIVPSTGGAARQVTKDDYDSSAPMWMPDGKKILTSGDHRPDAEYQLDGGEIFSVDVETGEFTQLTSRSGPDYSPVPSPSGKYIAYTGYDYKHWSYTVRKLYIMNSNGGNSKVLTTHLDRDVRNVVWAPDESGLYFTVQDRGLTNIYFSDLSGNCKKITDGYFQISRFTISNTGQIAATISSPEDPTDIYTFSINNPSKIKRITNVNENLLVNYKLGELEEIWYKSFDGKKIQGWIIKPPYFDPSKKYPLILYIHGGPHAMYGVRFNSEFQMLAARGYVVLYTNPRGSTGYGQEFGNIIQYHYPGDDFKDLMAGVDEVIKRGYIDDKKLCVTGGSGGGLLTAWVIGHTNRFCAAVSQYPVTNWITEIGTADAGYYFGSVWMDGMPWENPDFYIKRSPLFYAKNFKTPTMIITGEEDYRTPIAESEELYHALKAQKIDAVLIRVPGEPHGAARRYISHRIAKVLYIIDWFDKYTKKK
ncbi:S9 family peptidase [candidate division KSB1 bacterium]|nr:MAG: S9 family peptidase [candidate division KSB1 bacterium]